MDPKQKRKERSDYIFLGDLQVRAAEAGTADNKMVLEGRAVVFNSKTLLFRIGSTDYYEIIERGALDEADMKNCFFKFNHSDQVFPLARTKNGSLKLAISDDGLDVRAELLDTPDSRTVYEMVRSGLIDKMSFAFVPREESYDEVEHTFKVRKIDKLYDVAAVALPAYEDTSLYARRYGDVEARLAQVEALELQRKRSLAELEVIRNK